MLEVTPAARSDLEAIFAIADAWKITKVKNLEGGFLVSDFSLEDYRAAFDQGCDFFVARQDNEIVAFLYGYGSDHIPASDVVNGLVKANMYDDFFLIKQICIKQNRQNAGQAASRLYDHVKAFGTPVAAAIIMDPLNQRSIAFHERKGFKKILEVDAPKDFDGVERVRGIWAYFPEGGKKDIRTLSLAHKNVADNIVDYYCGILGLYTHEDNLNWTKLGMNVTFMFALLASVPYVTSRPGDGLEEKLVGGVVIVIGFLINAFFHLKIRSGLRYLAHHKNKVKAIEKDLCKFYGYEMVLNSDDANISGTSITSALMRHATTAMLAVWTVASAVIVYRVF